MRARTSEKFRGGTKCPTPIGRPQLKTLQEFAVAREAFAPAASLGRFAETLRETWESDLGESRLQLQVEGAPAAQQWRWRARHLFTEERPLGLIRQAENLRRGTAKVVGGLASRGAERRGCARSDCGTGNGFVRWSMVEAKSGSEGAEVDRCDEAEVL
jgi:hypothetical protein